MTNWILLIPLTLGKATPLLLAGMGGLLSETSGVINFALEGMMLMGAFGAVWASYASGSPWAGLLGGTAGGMFIGLLHALVTLKLRANQIVSSIALNLLAAGLSGMLLNQFFGVYGTSPSVVGLPTLEELLPGSSGVTSGSPIGPFGAMSPLAPAALGIALLNIVFFRWTVWGLRTRSCGENPLAAGAAGLSVCRIRFFAVLVGGALAGMGGAYLSIAELSQFVEQMTRGRGYLAIAAVILGRWKPEGVLLAALFFGFSEVLSEWLTVSWSYLPSQLYLALPYGLCFLALMLRPGRSQPPTSLGR